jgi:CBS domain-containing protein
MDKTKIPISEIMTKRPVTVKSGQSVNYAAKLMKKYKISSVLVMNKKELLGLITCDDIVYKLLAEKRDPQDVTVNDIMSTNIETITPTTSLQLAMKLLSEADIRQLPIVNNGALQGLVTLKDIIRYEPTLVDMMVENIRFEEQQRQETIRKYSLNDIDDSYFE